MTPKYQINSWASGSTVNINLWQQATFLGRFNDHDLYYHNSNDTMFGIIFTVIHSHINYWCFLDAQPTMPAIQEAQKRAYSLLHLYNP